MKLPFPMDGTCNPAACVQGDCYRFTLITDRILRLEYDPEGIFEDRPSQTVLNRNFPAPEYRVKDNSARLEIDTKHYHLTYHYGREKRFTENSLIIDAKNNFTNYGGCWRFGTTTYGDPPRHHNLYGTARTLDKADGAVLLERGLMDSSGRSFFDDSETALFAPDGTLTSRRPGTADVYYICCQRDYGETLKDFYRITGRPPMLPRYALGNWWSRYYAYTSDSYLALLDRFAAEDVPFSMAVLDMDWHVTDIDPKYGKGWTGYTWNRELFPDPKDFLQTLHRRGMHTSLNLHPADGVQGYEEAYPQMAAATGVDAENEEPVLFDMTDPVFTKAYFEHLMHPLEADGVDHWWIDWQQGRKSPIPNVDPLWLLNHNHYVDNCRDGRRGLIMSRYAGLGNHRYPVGFSGDTIATWESLDFQAYFNITAANAGFPFWSHDIGGFTGGVRDPELFIRWVQLGTFSAILRLHSTNNDFASKEPWNYAPAATPVIAHWLRLRHKLIPYLYTETWRQHTALEPMIRPIYYGFPGENRAYTEKNQYLFGSELMVCPITAPADPATGMGRVKAWIPEGIWTDIFTGKTYVGDRVAILNRSLEYYPVLATAGAILPTAVYPKGSNITENPEELEIFVFPGASGSYTLFEDDGLTSDFEEGKAFLTTFTFDDQANTFTIQGQGNTSLVPEKRKFTIVFRGFEPFTPTCTDGTIEHIRYDSETRSVYVTLTEMPADRAVTLQLPSAERETNSDANERVIRFLRLAKLSINLKRDIGALIGRGFGAARILEELQAEQTDRRLMEVLTELFIS
ncbi:MAG: DUF5110 domain-containing protein [Lachnospiraceae bacterium]|nr:DUF5110 domain-containing protein [Lachnospiraceae bacterium]